MNGILYSMCYQNQLLVIDCVDRPQGLILQGETPTYGNLI